ncbi:HNH endonuclease [Curtobacterium sp. YR515]|uniref:HNH endonuclease n=1 Tax=Curtobacterium sp. YR515 TaxID=1855316 RepID=UPI00158751BC|nr:HNH endonuclease [Curtobacterium sp. YR515]
MYCEVLTDDAAYSAVEHIKPKSVFPELVLVWENLGLVCPKCNTNKRDYWTEDGSLQILDPYRDDVPAHLDFLGPLVLASNESSRGVNTIRKLKLDTREDLVISKMKRIQELESRIRVWNSESRAEFKKLFAEDVREAFAPAREFSATLRSFAESRGFPV